MVLVSWHNLRLSAFATSESLELLRLVIFFRACSFENLWASISSFFFLRENLSRACPLDNVQHHSQFWRTLQNFIENTFLIVTSCNNLFKLSSLSIWLSGRKSEDEEDGCFSSKFVIRFVQQFLMASQVTWSNSVQVWQNFTEVRRFKIDKDAGLTFG